MILTAMKAWLTVERTILPLMSTLSALESQDQSLSQWWTKYWITACIIGMIFSVIDWVVPCSLELVMVTSKIVLMRSLRNPEARRVEMFWSYVLKNHTSLTFPFIENVKSFMPSYSNYAADLSKKLTKTLEVVVTEDGAQPLKKPSQE